MFETGTVLATINDEFHVKCDVLQLLNWLQNISECFSFNFFMLSSREFRKKKLYDKYENIKKEKPAES